MHIIVIGCGKVGSKLAGILSLDGHDVVIVDNDKKNFSSLSSDFTGVTVAGVPIDQDVLRQAGIENADAIAAVTPDDNVNIMICQLAREIFKVPKVIARIYNPAREYVFHQFGLETICPTNITVETIKSKIIGNSGVYRNTIGGFDFAFGHVPVKAGQEGTELGKIKVDKGKMIFGLIKEDEFHFYNPSIVVHAGNIIVMAQKE